MYSGGVLVIVGREVAVAKGEGEGWAVEVDVGFLVGTIVALGACVAVGAGCVGGGKVGL